MVVFARRTATITGRVLGEDGHAIADVLIEEAPNRGDIRLIVNSAYEKRLPVHTDRQGRFRMPNRAPLPNFCLRVSHPDFIDSEFGSFTLAQANTTDTGDVVLRKGNPVTIEAIGPRGPVGGGEVLLIPLDSKRPRSHPVQIVTNANGQGRTTASGATRVNYRVLLIPGGLTLGEAPSNPASLALDGSDRLVFQLVEPHFLSGTIVGSGGKPIPKAEILAHRVDK